MAATNDGVKNEEIIANYLDGALFTRLSEYWKGVVKAISTDVNKESIFRCKKIGGKGLKPDILLKIDDSEYGISIKKGSGNSVHQEQSRHFIDYCKQFLGMTNYEEECLLLFLYGDGTIDGSAPKENRLSIEEIRETYSSEIKCIQNFLEKNKVELIYRFLKYGKDGIRAKYKADYIYHGTIDNGVCCPLDSLMVEKISLLPSDKKSLSIGPLSLQVWNRNPSEDKENRRHSVQIKWTSCEKDLKELKLQYEKSLSENKNRIIGDNSHGFKNQNIIINVLNNNTIKNLPIILGKLIKEISPNVLSTTKIKAYNASGKARVCIKVDDIIKKVSVFMGTGNSVHQEKIDTFISFCKSLGMTDFEEKAFLTIHYADGTIDGTGEVKNRLDGRNEIYSAYSEELKCAQNFLNKHKKDLLERFLVYGRKELNNKVDYIYYGNYNDGVYSSTDSFIDYLCKIDNSQNATLSIGPLSIQTWGRNLSGKANMEDRRHSIQVKFSKIREHLYNAYENNEINKVSLQFGTSEGTIEEYALVRELNMNHNIHYDKWRELSKLVGLNDIDNIYAIRITSHVFSNLSERKVLPKADIYLMNIDLPEDYLIMHNYVIDEEMFEDELRGYSKKTINNSGISCKIRDSKHFTYEKLSVESFKKLFGNAFIGCGVCLFVKNEEDLMLNKKIIDTWQINYNDFIEYWKKQIDFEEREVLLNSEICKLIKKKSEESIRNIIENNNQIKDIIFRGDTIFDEPYNAPIIYSKGKIRENIVEQYTITTGSGRHKGNCTIVIKP